MIKAAFVTQHAALPWKRQLPGEHTVFEGVEFFTPVSEAEIVFVYDALPERRLKLESTAITVFVASEPSNVKRYIPAFLAQFDVVITSDRDTLHPRRIFDHAGLNWHVGCMASGGSLLDAPMSFKDFEIHTPTKTKLVSVVSSDKTLTPEHRARLDFVAKLKKALGDQVDVFGRGIVDFDDKRDVLDAYRYHIAIENCSIENYWTEKIADPYLTLTYPIYYGCPNISDYFPEHSLKVINIYKPDEAIQTIKEIIDSDLAERRKEDLIEARRRVMYEHNVFGLLAKVAKDLKITKNNFEKKQLPIVLFQEIHFMNFLLKLKYWLRYRISKLPVLLKLLKNLKQNAYFLKEK